MKRSETYRRVHEEIIHTCFEYDRFNSMIEGCLVLMLQVDELWNIVKLKTGTARKIMAREKAVKVAALTIRFLKDCC